MYSWRNKKKIFIWILSLSGALPGFTERMKTLLFPGFFTHSLGPKDVQLYLIWVYTIYLDLADVVNTDVFI